MTKKILFSLVVMALAFAASSLMMAWTEGETVDLQSAITGCGVTAEARCCKSDCVIACQREKAECMQGCGTMPADCHDTPIGPNCEAWTTCKAACIDEWNDCRVVSCGFCSPYC